MILLQGRDYSPPDGFWTASEQLLWPANRSDIYDVFPTITFYFPLHENASMQFGVTMPPQVRYDVTIMIVLLHLSVVVEARVVCMPQYHALNLVHVHWAFCCNNLLMLFNKFFLMNT